MSFSLLSKNNFIQKRKWFTYTGCESSYSVNTCKFIFLQPTTTTLHFTLGHDH